MAPCALARPLAAAASGLRSYERLRRRCIGRAPVILNQKGERGLDRRGAVASPTARLAVLSALLAILVVGAVLVPLPILTVHPGPTPDVSKLVAIDGSTYPSRGTFHMTTVTVRPATFVRAIAALFNPVVSVIPREAVYTPGKSEKEIVQEN